MSEANVARYPDWLGWLVQCLRHRFCRHAFLLSDLEKTGIPEPEYPTYPYNRATWNEYYHGDWHKKRVQWPCAKCGKMFFAHCGLDISPEHGPTPH